MLSVALIRAEYISMLSPCVVPPTGVHQLAAVLKQEDIPIKKILDLQVVRYKKIVNKLDELIKLKPDIIGISSVSNHLKLTNWISQYIKDKNSDIIIVVGGPLASANPNGVMASPFIDFSIIGEGEISFPSLIKCLHNSNDYRNIDGLVYRDGESIIRNKPAIIKQHLDNLPIIDWDNVNFNIYSKFLSMGFRRSVFAPILTSRGCPFSCIYCHKIFGNKFRARSPDHVLNELHLLYDKYRIRRFEFIDDIFNWDYDRAYTILARMRDELPDISVVFGNGLRADLLDEPFIKLLKEVNCIFLGIPVETSSARLQRQIKKNVNLQKVQEAVSISKKFKIHTWGLFMLGFPSETVEEMEETINYANELGVDFLAIQTANPYEGTELSKQLDQKKLKADELGKIHGWFRNDKSEKDRINRYKLKVMRNRMIRPANYYFLINFALWKIWWFGWYHIFLHIINLLKEYLSKKNAYTVDLFDKEQKTIGDSIYWTLFKKK